jgi:hypothetical protein
MKTLVKTLAVAAFALAGTFVATTAQASAANFNVYFKVHNADTNGNSMILVGTPPATVTGLSTGSTSPGGDNPSTGHATYSDVLPGSGLSKSVQLTFETAGGGGAGVCTFTIKVTNDGSPLGTYFLQFSSDQPRCMVPGSVHSSTGQFTGTTYQLNWQAS